MTYRGVAQLGARVVWDHEAAGSIPVTSTKKQRQFSTRGLLLLFFFILFCVGLKVNDSFILQQ